MIFLYYGIILFVCGIIIPSILYFFKKDEKNFLLFIKINALFFLLVFICRYMWNSDSIQNMFQLSNTPLKSKFENFISLIMVWAGYSASLLLCMFAFYKIKLVNKMIKFFVLPISFLSIFLLPVLFTATIGKNAINLFNIRSVFYAVELGFLFAISLAFLIVDTDWKDFRKKISNLKHLKHRMNCKKSKAFYTNKSANFLFKAVWSWIKQAVLAIMKFFKNNWVTIFCVLIILFSTIPAYTIQGLFGDFKSYYSCKNFELPHRIILYVGIILPFIIHFSLKNLPFKEKKFYLAFICFGTLLSFSLNHKFQSFLDPTNWPLHLCNTAMYIMPIVLIFNMKKFFYFTYFINVAGAFFAMMMPNYDISLNMFSSGLLIFYINHFIAFFMPIIFVSLGMFKKPRFKEFIYSMLGFLVYFILVLVLNSMFSGMFEAGMVSKSTDFFFVNSDYIAAKLGQWCERLRNIKTTMHIGKIDMTFYPVYQSLFFLVYVGIGFAMWFLFEQGYSIAKSFADIRERKSKLKVEQLAFVKTLNGRSIKMPVSENLKNKLVLNNFSKKYGNSQKFAVFNANLEVNAGEVFGFLGPNGAGKSTIIKSIVGIQPITSGSISVFGFDVDKQSIEAKSKIGFVPDHYALYEKLTGREYINYIADLFNVSETERTERINSMVERFELNNAFDNQIKTYSHGMKQKIAIMSALVHDPKVWILDEPLTGLDPNSIFQVKECMKEHTKRGNIVFFSSHIIDVVERICDRIAIIKKGQILAIKTLDEIKKTGKGLEQFYMDTISEENTEQ